ncbi:MAG: histidine kinase [Acidobacteria bacterium]|nr:histidine kinase [Acidobacteriota bacterium]
MIRRQVIRALWITGTLLGLSMIAAAFSTFEFFSRVKVLSGKLERVDETILYQFTFAVNWALVAPFLFLLAQKYPLRNLINVLINVALLPLISFVRTVYGSMHTEFSEGKPITMDLIKTSMRIRFHRNIFYAAVILGIANLWRMYRENAERERRALQLEAQLAKEQVELLRTKLQPQFLFATLRTIGGLVRTDPDAADHMLVGLSGLLRRNLDFRERATVTLAEELEFVDRYLGLQDIELRAEIEDELLGREVPPMFLQAVVAEAAALGGPVEIAGRGSQLEVRVGSTVAGYASIES